MILLSISFVACGQQKKYVFNPKAKLLADSAYKVVKSDPGDTINLQTAIKLLKQATDIDSNYILGFGKTLSYQMLLKDYPEALITAKRMSDLRPQNADFFSTLGITYELNDDTISSKQYFQKAVNIYTQVLETLPDQKAISLTKSRKAINLLFLNHYQEGQEILNVLVQNSSDSIEKEGLKLYLNKTGREIISMFANGEQTKNISPNPQ